MARDTSQKDFSKTRLLAGELSCIFWNEYLFRLNSCRRKGLKPETASYFVSGGASALPKAILLALRYYAASLINCIILFVQSRRCDSVDAPMFLFANLRHNRFFREGVRPVRVGLYNLRYLRYPHLLARLSMAEWFLGIRLALRYYDAFMQSCERYCEERGEDVNVFRRLTLCGRLHYLDAILHAMAMEKSGGEIWTAGHFDRYAALASLLREHDAVTRLSACQHGLFEYAPEGRTYSPLFTDEYHLLFPESRPWAEANFLKNPNTIISVQPEKGHICFTTLPRVAGRGVVAFAAQELFPLDDPIMKTIRALQEQLSNGFDVIVYAHPLFPGIANALRDQGVPVYTQERHANIDVLVTRYSSLGIDYQRLGVPVLFVPFGDKVCVFANPEFVVCPDLDSFQLELRSILNYQATHIENQRPIQA